MDERLTSLGQKLIEARGDRSQREIARDAGIDVSTVSRIERGILDPSISTLAAIADALGVPIAALLGELGIPRPKTLAGRLLSLETEVPEVTALAHEMHADLHELLAVLVAHGIDLPGPLLERASPIRGRGATG